MLDFIRKSLRKKLLITFIAIGFIPFFILLIYTMFLTESRIVNKTISQQFDRTEVVIKLINNHLNSISKEVDFLSSLDVMDDILADDIDKRISRLLSQKAKDLDKGSIFNIINNNSIIIASSKFENILKKIDSTKFIKNKNGAYIKDKTIYFYSKIYSSFDANKKLGYLILQYKLNNLDDYLTHKNYMHSYIINPKTNLRIGDNISFNFSFDNSKKSSINSEHVIVYKRMNSFLNGWYIVYAVDKGVALQFLYDFLLFMLYISIYVIMIIIYISIKYSKEIVQPIEELTQTTENIIKSKNYTVQLYVKSKDEIGKLTHSFNKMLDTTSSALNKLEEENKLRLKRFIQLIEILNTIIQTKSEDECINTSIKQIHILTNKTHPHFTKETPDENNEGCISLFVTDFEQNKKIYFGSIELGLKIFDDENEKRFYNSIGTMIALQLDRIRLITRTMSVSKAKSAFISNMSHELRTPLNAIIGFSQLMISYEELTDDQQDTMANIESSSRYLLEMINDILDIAKIEAGKMEVNMIYTDILELLKSIYNMLMPLADDKELKFELITDRFDNKKYKTDSKMFQQIVINLLSNSIKFTKKGFITTELYNDETNIYIKIKDSGIGISQEHINLLFNDFTQVDNIMQKKHKGTGLGLSLSKKLANLLGAKIILNSEGLNQGTVSILEIPINPPS